jgi:hypothetical protein
MLDEQLRTFEFTEEEIVRIAQLILEMVSRETVTPIETVIFQQPEVLRRYSTLSASERKTFRARLIARLLHRAYRLALEQASRADDRIPETLME